MSYTIFVLSDITAIRVKVLSIPLLSSFLIPVAFIKRSTIKVNLDAESMQSVCGRIHLAEEEIVNITLLVLKTPLERMICHDCWLDLVPVDWPPVLLHQG